AAEVMATFSNDAFHLQSNAPGISVKSIVADLLDAPRVADAPWRMINGADGKPVKDVKKIAPVHVGGKINLRLNWWLNELECRLSALKTWIALKTSTGLLADLAAAVDREALSENSLLHLSTGMTARFGFDPRSSWNTLDTGFSPNDQNLSVQTFAATELLAAIGLQTFRPSITGESLVYACWKHALPAPIARAVASGVVDMHGLTVYRFLIRSSGKFKFFTRSTTWTRSRNG